MEYWSAGLVVAKLHQSVPKPLYYSVKYLHIFILLYLSRTLWCSEIVKSWLMEKREGIF